MKHDPFTLRVALEVDGSARGELYLDDNEGFGYKRGELVWRGFQATTYDDSKRQKRQGRLQEIVIQSGDLATALPEMVPSSYTPANVFAKGLEEVEVRVERIIVVGVETPPVSASALGKDGKQALEWTYEPGGGDRAGVVIVKDPAVTITQEWSVAIGF